MPVPHWAQEPYPLMSISPELASLPTWMGEAFAEHGFSSLTEIQQAVLADETVGRDLRIASATGSGKTVAVAMAVAAEVEQGCSDAAAAGADPAAPHGPSVLVVAPTRELAAQLQGELQWIYASLRARIALVLGGGAYGGELRSLRRRPTVLVGTPGRLLDHVQRGNVDLGNVKTVVLDEADQLMELGFKAELDAILSACPAGRRTLLVSATFGQVVRSLADRHQNNPLVVQGTPVGGAHADIDHVVHPLSPRDQLRGLANILLAAPPGRCLVFVAMRAQASQIAASLGELGFDAAALSGEMSQAERSRTLDAFRGGALRVLVATDVAARGIDVQDIQTVIHACPPRDAEALIHRSGRTGRAGQRGTSVMMATPGDMQQVRRVLQRARVKATWKPVPDATEVRTILDQRLVESLTEAEAPSAQATELAARLLEGQDPAALVAQLLTRVVRAEGCEPQEVQVVEPPRPRRPQGGDVSGRFARFEVNWGSSAGASPPRVLAMLCRRGRVDREHLGEIRVLDGCSVVEVDLEVADDFAAAMRKRDSRDRHIRIRPAGPPGHGGQEGHDGHRGHPQSHHGGYQGGPPRGPRPQRREAPRGAGPNTPSAQGGQGGQGGHRPLRRAAGDRPGH